MTTVKQPGSDEAAGADPLHGFVEFYKTSIHRTFGTAYRAAGGDNDVAHDATQEAYAVMLERWRDKEKLEGDIGRYVVGIAVRKVADFYRLREKDRCVPLEEENDPGYHETGYVRVLDAIAVLPAVLAVLDRAPRRQREVGVLYFLEEFDYTKIANVLDMDCSTARTHVQRLREKLGPLINRTSLDDQGGEWT